MRTEAPRRSRRPRRMRNGFAPSASELARILRRLAARHADQPDVVAVCEKWSQRVPTLEHQAQTLEGV